MLSGRRIELYLANTPRPTQCHTQQTSWNSKKWCNIPTPRHPSECRSAVWMLLSAGVLRVFKFIPTYQNIQVVLMHKRNQMEVLKLTYSTILLLYYVPAKRFHTSNQSSKPSVDLDPWLQFQFPENKTKKVLPKIVSGLLDLQKESAIRLIVALILRYNSKYIRDLQ